MTMVGITELKKEFSKYIQRLKAGETILVTRYGKPVARIIPRPDSIHGKLQAVVDNGLADWSGMTVKPGKPIAANPCNQQISDLISLDREQQ